MTISRRGFVAGGIATGLLAGGCSRPLGETIESGLSTITAPELGPGNRIEAALRRIEGEAGGTLGAEFVDTASGASLGINRDTRFGHCSSFKLSLAAFVLARDARGVDDADRRVRWGESELMAFSPFTSREVSRGASLRELARATQVFSDNTAANVLLREVGGPQALTTFWRGIGDRVSRLDRREPALNNVPATEFRDTSSPSAMARTVAKLVYGDVLPQDDRTMLRQWMIDTRTGTNRVRAGLPEDWTAGDKTGTSLWPGMGSLYVDIGFVEPPADGDTARAPITFATYFRTRTRTDGIDPEAEAVLASAGELLRDFANGKR